MAKINEVTKAYFEDHLNNLRLDHSELKDVKTYSIFTYLCIKNYFYESDDYDVSEVLEHIVDGSNDCSIDAICNSPSDEQELVFVQSKYRTTFDFTEAQGEVEEIKKAIAKLRKAHFNDFRDEVVQEYQMCQEETDSTNYKIVYFTSAVPKKNVKERVRKEIENDDIEFYFGDEITEYIDGVLEKTGKVKKGELIIDKANNKLEYDDSYIVNISALSLKNLYAKYQRALLGLNLRYYIKNKAVDSGLKETISAHPKAFWYLNNGLTIVASSFEVDGKILKLENFSIVNGGQTTNMIYQIDFDENNDFYVPCKVILDEFDDSYLSSDKIAEASNSQKPIKAKDLVANKQEQRDLKGKLKQIGFQYLTKKGETIEKKFKDRTKHGEIEPLGKLVMTSLLQMPWKRSDTKALYEDERIYNNVYRNTNPHLFPEMLKLDLYFKSYSKTNRIKRTMDPTLARNSRTFVLALISFASYVIQTGEEFNNLHGIQDHPEILEEIAAKIIKLDKIIVINSFDKETEKFYDLFDCIINDVIDPIYKYTGNGQDKSNFLKKKESYYECLKYMNGKIYTTSSDISKLCNELFGSK